MSLSGSFFELKTMLRNIKLSGQPSWKYLTLSGLTGIPKPVFQVLSFQVSSFFCQRPLFEKLLNICTHKNCWERMQFQMNYFPNVKDGKRSNCRFLIDNLEVVLIPNLDKRYVLISESDLLGGAQQTWITTSLSLLPISPKRNQDTLEQRCQTLRFMLSGDQVLSLTARNVNGSTQEFTRFLSAYSPRTNWKLRLLSQKCAHQFSRINLTASRGIPDGSRPPRIYDPHG